MLILNSSELDRITINAEENITNIIKILENGGHGICLVVYGANKNLIGTITDGDIRRFLLIKGGLEGSAEDIAKANHISAPVNFSVEQYREICLVNNIKQLPLVGASKELIGLFLVDSKPTPTNDCRLIIMAGGKGSRLKPYTDNCPKPMLKVGGVPIIERIIRKARSEGIHHVSISVNHLKESITTYLGNGDWLGVEIKYLHEDIPLGTAGGLEKLDCKEDILLITNGDVLTDVNYVDICNYHCINDAKATMSVKSYEWSCPFGVVKTNGIEIIDIKEKPSYIDYVNAGIYVLDKDCLRLLDADTYCDMPTLFETIKVNHKKTIVYPMHEPWIDIGRPSELLKARDLLK